jgi:DNA (cytosine-5)-methyltransferase 1
VNLPGRGGEDDHNLVFQANGSASFRRGAPTLASSDDNGSNQVVTHALRSEGTDTSEDGTGRGTPLVAVPYTLHGNIEECAVAASKTDTHQALRSRQPGGSEGSSTTVVAVPYVVNAAESCAKESHARQSETARSLDTTGGFAANQGGTVVAFNRLEDDFAPGETSPCLSAGDGQGKIAVGVTAWKESQSGCREGSAHATLDAHKGSRRQEGIVSGMVVRRLTPTECLRLMGLPDDWLDLDPPLSDSAKYRFIGDGGVTFVLEWIGNRIRAVAE